MNDVHLKLEFESSIEDIHEICFGTHTQEIVQLKHERH